MSPYERSLLHPAGVLSAANDQYGNQPGKSLADASPTDFDVTYRNDDFSIALSQGRYFCNDQRLPASFDINTAKALGSFLLSGQQAYAMPIASKSMCL
ncbi:hypothetical protein ACET8Y_06150 [Aeromonas veronii]